MPHDPPSAAKRSVALLVNPSAGSGRSLALAQRITALLQGWQVPHSVYSGEWPPRFDGFSDLWIVGGDGTLNRFLNAYPDIQLPLAIFPGGSGNDFSALLYGNKSADELAARLLKGGVQPVDAGICNGLYFVNGIGIGFDGAIAGALAGKNKRPGKASFMGVILKKIMFYRKISVFMEVDGKKSEKDILMMNLMNGQRVGGGFRVAPDADPGDGWLNVNLVNPINILKRLIVLPKMERGRHTTLTCVTYFQARQITISSKTKVPAHCDGEYFEASDFTIHILPAKWNFRRDDA